MSHMSDLDIVCQDIAAKARFAVESGEKSEDISEAVFDQIFNWSGRDPDLRDWAVNIANGVISEVFKEAEDDAAILRKKLNAITAVIQHLEKAGKLGKMETSDRLLLIGSMHGSISKSIGNTAAPNGSEEGEANVIPITKDSI